MKKVFVSSLAVFVVGALGGLATANSGGGWFYFSLLLCAGGVLGIAVSTPPGTFDPDDDVL